MNVREIAKLTREFETRVSKFKAITVLPGEPWHAKESWHDPFPYGNDAGIYVYSKPTDADWHIPASENAEPAWYVGKSYALGGRARDNGHLGPQYERDRNNALCVPKFKYHQWIGLDYIPEATRTAIAEGSFVIYVFAIRCDDGDFARLASEMLEKHILLESIFRSASLPDLNRSL